MIYNFFNRYSGDSYSSDYIYGDNYSSKLKEVKDCSKNNLQFGYTTMSYDDLDIYSFINITEEPFKVLEDAYKVFVKAVEHLAMSIHKVHSEPLSARACLYIAVRDLQEAYGIIALLFNATFPMAPKLYGHSHIKDSRLNKAGYVAFILNECNPYKNKSKQDKEMSEQDKEVSEQGKEVSEQGKEKSKQDLAKKEVRKVHLDELSSEFFDDILPQLPYWMQDTLGSQLNCQFAAISAINAELYYELTVREKVPFDKLKFFKALHFCGSEFKDKITKLSFKDIDLSKNDIRFIDNNCKNLEFLYLNNCRIDKFFQQDELHGKFVNNIFQEFGEGYTFDLLKKY